MGDGFFSKLKTLIGIEEVEDDGADEEVSVNAAERKPIDPRGSQYPQRNEAKDNKDIKDTRVLPITGKVAGANQFKLIVIEPSGFDECPRLVDSLKAKKPVIINLEKIETDTARKIFDFLSGATYALNGNVQKIANNIFIFAPENVDVTAYIDQQAPGHTTVINNPWR
ncbi:MAG TPA: cell division protein SepF [Bacillota bacterium]|jgi:cell division inhibitor SepF|nr:cell division protein SepF [Bacillota bacterium]